MRAPRSLPPACASIPQRGLPSAFYTHTVAELIAVHGTLPDDISELTSSAWPEGLDRTAYRRFGTAVAQTAWALGGVQRFALVDGATCLAAATRYDLRAVLDGRIVPVCGIGQVVTASAHRGAGHARALVETLVERAAGSGEALALLFASPDLDAEARRGFQSLPLVDLTLRVAEPVRYGAPMTMVRCGEDRDLQAVAAMGRVRAEPIRFHLDRDVDFAQHAITRSRLLAGLGVSGARQLQFFIAEEGVTAAAYVVIRVVGDDWTIEDCGDRDPSGARVGALLQALLAREPMERRPTIHGWLPPGFMPPQVAVLAAGPSPDVVLVRALQDTVLEPSLSVADVLFWRGDVF